MLESALAYPDATAVRVNPRDESAALAALTRAFANDPPCRWLFPDAQQYQRYFPAFARAFGGAAIVQGTALATHDRAGVALWLAPCVGPDEDALARVIEASVDTPRKAEVSALFAEMGRVHPTE